MRTRIPILSATLALIVVGATATAQQPQRRPISHEDVFLMKRLGSVSVSPDGRWVVFSVTEPSYVDAEAVSDLWIVPSDGSAQPRRLTATRGGEGSPAWSPDGRRLAFSARRDGDDVSQIYVLDVAQAGEAQRVTASVTGAGVPRWRPDGSAILFSSSVYPGAAGDSANRAAAAERRNRRWNARVYDSSPIRFWDRWLDDRRPSLFVQPLEPGAPARDILAGTQLVAGAGFGGQIGTGGDGISAAWTPDGSGIVFGATTNRNAWAYAEGVQSLWLVPAGGGEPRRLTPDSDNHLDPQFSPDGRTLYARLFPANEFVYNHDRLVAWAWPGMGPRRVVAGGADRSVDGYAVAPDGRTIYFLSQDAGQVKLFRAAATGGDMREVGQLTSGSYGGLDVAGTAAAPVLAGVWESAVNPPEIVRMDASSGRATPLSRFNVERAARIDWQPVRHFWFTSSRGKRIHNMLVVPPAFDENRRYPLLVLMHGGPHSMWTDQFVLRWNYHLLGSPGYVVLLTNYTGSTGFSERFAQEIQGDPLAGPGREVEEAADEAIRRFRFIDARRQAAAGASYGGHMANWMAVTTTRFRALVSHAGLWDLESQYATSDVNYGRERNMGGPPWEDIPGWREQSPMRRAAQLRTPMLVTAGERDYRVPVNNTMELWTALQRQRVPSRLIVFPDENHWILRGENSRFWYSEVHAWLARWLREDAPAGN